MPYLEPVNSLVLRWLDCSTFLPRFRRVLADGSEKVLRTLRRGNLSSED
jgi:hypothetical protein